MHIYVHVWHNYSNTQQPAGCSPNHHKITHAVMLIVADTSLSLPLHAIGQQLLSAVTAMLQYSCYSSTHTANMPQGCAICGQLVGSQCCRGTCIRTLCANTSGCSCNLSLTRLVCQSPAAWLNLFAGAALPLPLHATRA